MRSFCWLPLLSLAVGCVCSREVSRSEAAKALASEFLWDEGAAKKDLATLTHAPHPLGSKRQQELQHWLEQRLLDQKLAPVRQAFTAITPNPSAKGASGPVAVTRELRGANIYGTVIGSVGDCAIVLATHFDTKEIPEGPYLGANDSGSSTAVVLQVLAYLAKKPQKERPRCDILGAFFDGEEAVLDDWFEGERLHPARVVDHTYGSRFAAKELQPCAPNGFGSKCLPSQLGSKPLAALVLLDMVGSPNLKITRDAFSSPEMTELAAEAAAALGVPEAYGREAQGVEDDHVPFREAGVKVIDLIDFHHLEHWHRASDRVETLSHASMELAGRLALYLAVVAGGN